MSSKQGILLFTRLSFVAAVMALIALSGCNGDGDGDDDLPAMPTATAPPTATPPVAPTLTPGGPQPGAGLSSSVLEATVDDMGQVATVFTLTDDSGVPIRPVLSSTSDPAEARVRFTIAHLEEYSGGGELDETFTRYVNEINPTRPTFDRDGTLESVDPAGGVYRYVFNTRLPEGFDRSQTLSIGLQIDRSFEGLQLGVNPVFDFVPAGGVPQVRAASATELCNQCHDPLIEHGNRRELRLCLLCHTEAAVDELGRSIDMRVMVHKIHRGRDLPSIVQGPPGTTYAVFSSFARMDVVFAQKEEDGDITGVGFPRPIRDCLVCHADGPTAENHLTEPSSDACASCHDDVNPSLVPTEAGPPGTGHFQNQGFADGDCGFCHVPIGVEFDISVAGAHVIPERSTQLEGLNVEILGLTNHRAGQTPVVTFRITNVDGEPLLDLSGLNRVAFTIAGPTIEYQRAITVTAAGGGAAGTLTGPDEMGAFQYTFAQPVPADATGTWSLAAEARRSVQLTGPNAAPTVNEAAINPVVTFTVDNSMPVPRRIVVADENCQSCHGPFSRGFSIHGNLRNQVEYCVMCHNPNATDAARRRLDPAAVERGSETASIDFKVMIHKIHTGEELEMKPYLIYGFGPPPQGFTIHDFSEVRFPGDREKCVECHVDATFLLPPFPGSAIGPIQAHLDPATGEEIVDGRTPPITAVCTACHDSAAAITHAQTQTAPDGSEACLICHSEGRPFAVSVEHTPEQG